jgi:competence protein ComEA
VAETETFRGLQQRSVSMEHWKDLLAYNRSERRGIWLLILLIIAITSTRLLMQQWGKRGESVHIEHILAEAQPRFRNQTWQNQKRPDHRRDFGDGKKDSLFYFDPNTIGAVAWQTLGLSEKQASVITGYISKGGRFRTKEDLKKSFVISERFYSKIEPWIRIQSQVPGNTPADSARAPKQVKDRPWLASVDLNGADTAQLNTLKGIGNVLAKRIVTYRSLLGGFHSIAQLEEVYGLTPEVIHMNQHRLMVTATNITGIQINTAPEKSLATHPYISKKLAYMIVTIRQERPITSLEDLRKRLPPESIINAHLLPYLRF